MQGRHCGLCTKGGRTVQVCLGTLPLTLLVRRLCAHSVAPFCVLHPCAQGCALLPRAGWLHIWRLVIGQLRLWGVADGSRESWSNKPSTVIQLRSDWYCTQRYHLCGSVKQCKCKWSTLLKGGL